LIRSSFQYSSSSIPCSGRQNIRAPSARTRASGKIISRIDLVPERLPDLRDPKRQFLPRRIEHILELDEYRLRRLRAKIGHAVLVFRRPDERFEHQVKRRAAR